MKSSYKENKLDIVFKTLCGIIKPTKIVEFGILDGYSLKTFIENTGTDCIIEAYDIFDDFPYNAANYNHILKEYGSDRVNIIKSDFYKSVEMFDDNSVDIMHIDIANDADVIKFAIENYMSKITNNGVMVFEGGSLERDEVYWMNEFNKKKINPYLQGLMNDYNITIINDYPSITIMKK